MPINKAALLHESRSPVLYPLDKDRLEILLKTGKEIQQADLIIGDPFTAGCSGSKAGWEGETIPMRLAGEEPDHKIWCAVFRPPFRRSMYVFHVRAEEESGWLMENGFQDEETYKNPQIRRQYFFDPWFFAEQAFAAPAGIQETIWYQIFPDRYCRKEQHRPASELRDWNALPENGFEHYGGTLKGILEKLDYIQSLGVDGIYLNPIFLADFTNHKYNTTDYTQIDPDFGTEEDLLELISELHRRGMKIMLDGVFNHSGLTFGPWLDVCENQENSRYRDWFMINEFPVDRLDRSQAAEGKYYSFAFESYMPKLNTANPEVQDYLNSLMEHWVRDWKIDGIRFDVANEVAHSFLKETRKRLKAINPDVYLMGEIWHNSQPWLMGDEFDAVMNYPFAFALETFWNQPEKSSQDLAQQLDRCLYMYPKAVLDVQFNLLDSHDTDRLFYRLHQDPDAYWQNLLMLACFPGSHCFYYGTELEMDGADDPDCRRTMPWEKLEAGEFSESLETFRSLTKLMKEHPVLSSRRFDWKNPENSRLIHFEKRPDPSDEKQEEEILEIWMNAGKEPEEIIVPEGAEILLERKFSGSRLLPGGLLVCRA